MSSRTRWVETEQHIFSSHFLIYTSRCVEHCRTRHAHVRPDDLRTDLHASFFSCDVLHLSLLQLLFWGFSTFSLFFRRWTAAQRCWRLVRDVASVKPNTEHFALSMQYCHLVDSLWQTPQFFKMLKTGPAKFVQNLESIRSFIFTDLYKKQQYLSINLLSEELIMYCFLLWYYYTNTFCLYFML